MGVTVDQMVVDNRERELNPGQCLNQLLQAVDYYTVAMNQVFATTLSAPEVDLLRHELDAEDHLGTALEVERKFAAITERLKLWSGMSGLPASASEQTEPKHEIPTGGVHLNRTMLATYIGHVLEIDGGTARAMLEEDDGFQTEVELAAEQLVRIGVGSGERFRYTVLDTGTGTESVFEPLRPIHRTKAELEERARRAARMAAGMPHTTGNATVK